MRKKAKQFRLSYYKENGIVICSFIHPRTGEEKKVHVFEDDSELMEAMSYIINLHEPCDIIMDIITAGSPQDAINMLMPRLMKQGNKSITLINKDTGKGFKVPSPN